MNIRASNYNGLSMILVDDKGEAVHEDAYVADHTGELWILEGGYAPRHIASTGRIFVKDDDGEAREFFPGVCGLHWSYMVSEGEA